MIIKVYIVRCSYCHASLRDPNGSDHRPMYFYQLDSIPEVMRESGWGVISGVQVCKSCIRVSSTPPPTASEY